MNGFGEDSLTRLVFTIQANKGVYALLLGSGISTSSGIKTGWGITCDLIARYAAGNNEKDPGFESDQQRDQYWANWYRKKYNKEPDYSDLLEKLGHTIYERQSIVKSYIEPSPEDLKKGKKSPTKAHHAIAKLVKNGFIKVIITTNFDRLLEQALNHIGITPTVISSENDISGQEPLNHSTCYIIKVHGDYKDGRIKNTMNELSDYPDEYKSLLKRIFNDYGLIICGWSAAWDIALKQAIRSATSRRYSLFWASYSELGEEAKQLVQERDGEVISINKMGGADGFFSQLQEKVEQIEKLSLRRPRTEALILSTLKDYLSEPEKNRIRIEGLFKEELTTQLLDFPEFHKPDWVDKSWEDKFTICENQTKTLAKMVGILGVYGTGKNKEVELICNMVQTICYELRNKRERNNALPVIDNDKTNLAYPAYLLFTIYGSALVQTENWNNLYKLLTFDLKSYYGNAYNNKAYYYFSYTQFEHNSKKQGNNFINFRTELIKKWSEDCLSHFNFDLSITILDLLGFLTSIQFSRNEKQINEILIKHKQKNLSCQDLYQSTYMANFEKTHGKMNGAENRLTNLDYPLNNINKDEVRSKFNNPEFINNLNKAGFTIIKNNLVFNLFIFNNEPVIVNFIDEFY